MVLGRADAVVSIRFSKKAACRHASHFRH